MAPTDIFCSLRRMHTDMLPDDNCDPRDFTYFLLSNTGTEYSIAQVDVAVSEGWENSTPVQWLNSRHKAIERTMALPGATPEDIAGWAPKLHLLCSLGIPGPVNATLTFSSGTAMPLTFPNGLFFELDGFGDDMVVVPYELGHPDKGTEVINLLERWEASYVGREHWSRKLAALELDGVRVDVGFLSEHRFAGFIPSEEGEILGFVMTRKGN